MEETREHDVLVVAVNYETTALARSFISSFAAEPLRGRVQLVLADNSPSADPTLVADAAAVDVRHVHLPTNPGYMGAAGEVLERLVDELGAPLPFDAVVLCNVDLDFDYSALVAAIADAHRHTGDWRWLLGPDIVEPGKYRVNPQSMRRPARHNGRLRHDWRRRSFVFDVCYRSVWRLRRRFIKNAHADLPAFTPMYSAGGAFTIFGVGFFIAGGVFHDAPLFSEEYSFAEQAYQLGVPVLYVPQLVVTHQSEASTSARQRGHRQRHEWFLAADRFYREWEPHHVVGDMAAWFVDD